MAASSSTIALMHVSVKLVRTNYMVWKAQVLVVLRGAQLTGFLDGFVKAPTEKIKIKNQKEEEGEVMNPSFAAWKAQEQQFLSYLLTFVSRYMLI
jgi:hypothetical protein